MARAAAPLNVLTATASDIRALLDNGDLTSEQVVRAYLDQIEKHNKQGLELRAIISVSETSALKQAAQLDAERANGKLRGPLHGIPITLKDCIQTSAELEMPTTGGAGIFANAVARKDAEVVRRLREKGLIVLGKASLTEYCGAKGRAHTTGWCSVNGQTQSAWIPGGMRKDDAFWGRSTPGGSSSGSAVGVAAGFTPLSIGTETGGSSCLPANRQGLYMLKLSHDHELLPGVMPLCKNFDGLGAFGRSAVDVELTVQAISGDRKVKSISSRWQDIRIGFIEPHKWGAVPADRKDWDESHEQIARGYEHAIDRLHSRGARVVYPVLLAQPSNFSVDGTSLLHMTSHVDIKREWPEWLADMDHVPAKNLEEIIEWNKANPEVGMPEREWCTYDREIVPADGDEAHADQDFLLDVLNSKVTPEQAAEAFASVPPRVRQAIDECLESNDVDIIIGPGDCSLCSLASMGQCPSAMVPMTVLKGVKGMGQPQGLMIISARHQEDKMLSFMKLWSSIQEPWQIPTIFR